METLINILFAVIPAVNLVRSATEHRLCIHVVRVGIYRPVGVAVCLNSHNLKPATFSPATHCGVRGDDLILEPPRRLGRRSPLLGHERKLVLKAQALIIKPAGNECIISGFRTDQKAV